MTPVPPPASPCLRVRLIYNEGAVGEGGNRLFFSYTGSAPTGDQCAEVASQVASSWESDLAGFVTADYSLEEVDVLDIASDSGLSGQWTGTHTGSDSGATLPVQCATNVEFGIARRYRGGKPRIYLPPAGAGHLLDEGHWAAAFLASMNTSFGDFIAGIEGGSYGGLGTLAHVNLSYYKGFTNVTTPSGRERAVPTYRSEALVDPITGYFTKAVIGSQRRRRTSTTP